MSARENILARIRARQAKSALPDADEREAARAHIAAHSQNPRPATNWDPIARFCAEALELASTVDEVESLAAAPAAVARYLEAQRLPREAVCWEAFAELNWRAADIEQTVTLGAHGPYRVHIILVGNAL